MDKGEWYFEVGYVELLYAAMVVGIVIALYYFRHLKQASELAANLVEEHSLLLGLLVLAVVLFVLNRVLGDLW
jgi:heme/copper-type cytochrome/quinol oxidase subunit 4